MSQRPSPWIQACTFQLASVLAAVVVVQPLLASRGGQRRATAAMDRAIPCDPPYSSPL